MAFDGKDREERDGYIRAQTIIPVRSKRRWLRWPEPMRSDFRGVRSGTQFISTWARGVFIGVVACMLKTLFANSPVSWDMVLYSALAGVLWYLVVVGVKLVGMPWRLAREIERLLCGFEQVERVGKLRLLAVEVEKLKRGVVSSGVQLGILTELDKERPLNDGWIANLDPKTRAYCELYALLMAYDDHREKLGYYACGGDLQPTVWKNPRPVKLTVSELYAMLLEHERALQDHAAKLLQAVSNKTATS